MRHLLLIATLVLAHLSCNNTRKADHSGHDSSSSRKQKLKVEENEVVQQVKPVFTNLDGNVASHIKTIFDHYIHVKSALVSSNTTEAENGAKNMLVALKIFDRSLIPMELKLTYDKSIRDIRTAATGVASADDLKKQREYFANLSASAYDLARSFGAGKTVYHEYCPMAFDNKGAMWLSESKEVRNPYYGEEMLGCGTIKEIIEK